MSQQALSNVGLNNNWDVGAGNWKAGMDTNLALLDGLVQPNVATRGATSPPASPAPGDRYLVPRTGLGGDFTGHANSFAVWSGTAWLYVAPLPGWSLYIADERLWVHWDGAQWSVRGMRESAVSVRPVASSGGALALDASSGEAWDVVLTENITNWTITHAIPAPGVTKLRIRLKQDATGGHTVVLPANTKTPGGAAYTASPAANAVDVITLQSWDAGATWYAVANQNFT